MINKKGQRFNGMAFLWILGAIAVGIVVWSLSAKNGAFSQGQTLASKFSSGLGNVKGFEQIPAFGDSFVWLNYIFGKIPQTLIDSTSGGEISAAIIIIGLWFILFLTFADVMRLFGTFNTATAWIIGFVLAVVAANLKIVTSIAIVSLIFTAAFGALSVFASIILVFVLFLGVNFGIDSLRKFAVRKKISEMKIRAAMGSAAAKEGLKALKEIGHEVGKNES